MLAKDSFKTHIRFGLDSRSDILRHKNFGDRVWVLKFANFNTLTPYRKFL